MIIAIFAKRFKKCIEHIIAENCELKIADKKLNSPAGYREYEIWEA
jgi:hypothetical protein